MVVSPDQKTGTCEYCGSTMTIPKVDDDQRAAAFNRGNHFRRIGEFDKALSVYESIVREDETDAEAHWCCALCRFGIEYVKDPASGEYIPTCHRASFDSFLEDVDYQEALKHADVVARAQYQKDAEKIAQVQRGILSISQKEQPFDVFICYKETDENGNRTVDSTLAQDIYYQLTEQGRRVFFARITLEDKAGQEYEPYIFAALHSAKVMVVVGTKPEYLNAVWVKNEWSRYLALMKHDRKRLLIPCYRDMDPYDLPEQLSVLQSYDMSKIGFIQDLIRGIAKVLDADKKPEEKVVERVIEHDAGGVAPGIDSLMKRAYLFTEDGDFDSADEYLNRVLDIDPNYAPAYAARTCTALQFRRESQLGEATFWYNSNPDWKKALRFADENQKKLYEEYEEKTDKRVKQQIRDYRYDCAIELAVNPSTSMAALVQEQSEYEASCITTEPDRRCNGVRRENYEKNEKRFKIAVETNEPGDVTEKVYKNAAEMLDQIEDVEAVASGKQCLALAEQARQKKIYQEAFEAYRKADTDRDAKGLWEAAEIFEMISNFRDASEQAESCRKKADKVKAEDYQEAADAMKTAGKGSQAWKQVCELLRSPNLDDYRDTAQLLAKAEEEYQKCYAAEERIRKQQEKKAEAQRNKVIVIAAGVIAIVLAGGVFLENVIQPALKYRSAEKMADAGEYNAAVAAFIALGDYKDAPDKILEVKYEKAESLLAAGKTDEAMEVFSALEDYSDSSDKVLEIKYQTAKNLMSAGKYDAAAEAFAALGDYSDASDKELENRYKAAESLMNAGKYDAAAEAFAALGDYEDAADRVKEPYYVEGTKYLQEQKYFEAAKVLMKVRGYRDVDTIFDEHSELYDAYFAVGNEVPFGQYEQDGDTRNGTEKIMWKVLAREGNKVLLLSKYGLAGKAYNNKWTDITWAQSTIRSWLNNEFMNTSFSSDEQAAILQTEVDNSQAEGYNGNGMNHKNNTDAESNTVDKVFLLSYKEAFEDYFTSDEARICIPTTHAVQQRKYKSDTGACRWWLRSRDRAAAMAVGYEGSFSKWGVDDSANYVRPALWLNLDSDMF